MGRPRMILRGDGLEKNEIKVEAGERDKCEDKVKRKRGRPPKVPRIDEAEKEMVSVKIEENDDAVELVNEGKKRKRGRPPILRRSSGSCEKADCIEIRENGHSGELGNNGKKRKRGRPPTLQQSSGSPEKGNCAEIRENIHSGELGNDGKKPKRGRPCILQQSSGSHKHADTVELVENGHSGALGTDGKRPNRGRPRKVQQNDGFQKKVTTAEAGENEHSRGLGNKRKKKKRGRPPKATVSGSIHDKARKGITRKRGRPCKVNGSDGSYKKDEKEKVAGLGGAEGLVSRGGPDKHFFVTSERLPSKNVWDKDFEPVKSIKSSNKEKSNNGPFASLKPKAAGEQKRSYVKRALRDRIVDLLLAAGWTIEYRPRSKKEYNDAVYVNPEGKTHWSVTLAYRKLKSQFEDANGNSNSGKSGFTFTPIPEEELGILTRVVRKTRIGKKKSKKKGKYEDEDVDEEEKRKKKKGKGKEKLKNKKSYEVSKMPVLGRKREPQESQNRKRSALLVRKSIGAESNGDGYVLYDAKRSLLSWMIDLGTVPLDGKVQYVNRRMSQVLREGKVTKNGIQCDCCGEIFAIYDFETHTGSELNQPFQNICLATGTSLLQCLLDSWNKQEECKLKGFHFVETCASDQNDDTCGICGDGGDLICCDSCPSTFHQSCLGIKKFPSGDWHCIYCTCKFCGMIGDYTCQRRADEDAIQSARISCCSLCGENYHQSCVQMEDAASYTPGSPTFCGKECQELFERLKILVGVENRLPEGFSWTLAHRFGNCSYASLGDEASREVVCNSKLAVALSVMDECFRPLVDHRSGTNLINNIVYNFGSNFKRLDYSGFLTAILERGDEIIAAASIRIHGNQFAEMPFIGTRYTYRRQGMCRRLLYAIESALSSLNVENLIIPAVSELKETWTSVFGFKPLDQPSKQKIRCMNMLVFPGVDMLQKTMLKDQCIQENILPPKGIVSNETMKCEGDEEFDRSHHRGPALFDLNMPDEGTPPYADNGISGTSAVDSGSQLPGDSLNSTSGVTAGTINQSETAAFVGSDLTGTSERAVSSSHGSDAAVRMPGDAKDSEQDDPQKAQALEFGSHVDKNMPDPLRMGNNLGTSSGVAC